MQQEPLFERVHFGRQTSAHPNIPHSDQITLAQREAHIQTVVFQVQGMSCASCAITLARVLKRLAGVQDVRIDAQTGRTELYCTPLPAFQLVQDTLRSKGYTMLPWRELSEMRSGVIPPVEIPPREAALQRVPHSPRDAQRGFSHQQYGLKAFLLVLFYS